MNITLNSNLESYSNNSMTINELLLAKGFTYRMLIIKINDVVVKNDNWDEVVVHDGDKIDIIHLFNGG